MLERRGPFHEHRKRVIEAGDRYFKGHGAKTVFIGRWIALIRFATAWLAGINHMPFRVFFPWNAVSGITWAVTYGLVGYFGGNAVAHVFARVGIIAAIVLAVLLVAALVWWRAREFRRVRAGRSSSAGGPAGPPQAAGGPAGPPAEEFALILGVEAQGN